MKTAYVVGYTGGFDWFFNAEDQETVYLREVLESKKIEDFHVIKFTYEYEDELSNDEDTGRIHLVNVTKAIDIYFNSSEFDEAHPEWHIKEYHIPNEREMTAEIKILKKDNFDLRMELKECRKLLEYNGIEIPA